MKSSNKPNVAVGIILLLAAAFFSIALILRGLDFGILGPGRNNILFSLGQMLFSVYGYSSALIPLFLFVAAISCFASKWTSQKAMQLLTAIVPF
ncbi:MAG: DNA translocase FtsK, partial [Treponema sp.]|nr:DNA translocase FtsK [Treponema sp.]